MPSNQNHRPPRDNNVNPRSQAELRASRRGEIIIIDFVEGLPERNAPRFNLPERHPADRNQSFAFTNTPSGSLPSNAQPPTTVTTSEEAPRTTFPILNLISKSSSILKFFKPAKSFGGLRFVTLLAFTFQLLLMGATAITWSFLTRILGRENMRGGSSSLVVVHITFLLAIIGQLIFLERRSFRIRCERYGYLHPGEILPHHQGVLRSEHIEAAFAPWNQSPPPTYAAALVQVTTSDIEGQHIEAPLPPAYGNTRGSTLLLQ